MVAWPPHLVPPAIAKIDGMRPSLGTSHELIRWRVAWPPHLVSPTIAKIDGIRPSLGMSHGCYVEGGMATSSGFSRHRQDRRYASKSGDVARAATLKGGVATSSGSPRHRQDRRYTSKFGDVAWAATL